MYTIKSSGIVFCFDATFDFLRNLIWAYARHKSFAKQCCMKTSLNDIFLQYVFHCLLMDLTYRLVEIVPKVYSECRNSGERGRIDSAQKQSQNHALMGLIRFY